MMPAGIIASAPAATTRAIATRCHGLVANSRRASLPAFRNGHAAQDRGGLGGPQAGGNLGQRRDQLRGRGAATGVGERFGERFVGRGRALPGDKYREAVLDGGPAASISYPAMPSGDRAVTAAEHANAGLLAAVSAFRLAHVFIRRKQAAQVHGLAMGAAGALERSGPLGDPERPSVLGGLHLTCALAAAADFDRAAADRSLAAARRVAERLGEDRNDHWTAFGPTNVRIHEVSAAVAFGDASTAVEPARRSSRSSASSRIRAR